MRATHSPRLLGVFSAVLIAGASLTAPAMAGSWTHSDMGGTVTVSAKTLSLRDSADDGRFVTSEYRFNNGNSSAGLSNKAGYGRTTSVTQSSNITNDKICRSNLYALPVDCGSWRW